MATHNIDKLNEEIKLNSLFDFGYDPLKDAIKLITHHLQSNATTINALNSRINELEKKQTEITHKPVSRVDTIKAEKSTDGKIIVHCYTAYTGISY